MGHYADFIKQRIYLKEAERFLREIRESESDSDSKISKDIEKAIALVVKIQKKILESQV